MLGGHNWGRMIRVGVGSIALRVNDLQRPTECSEAALDYVLLALGATEVHWNRRQPDADYVILADPEGNRFCVVDIN